MTSTDDLSFLPCNFARALFDFQQKGVQYGIRHGGRCLIGDEMGLGKTLQALSIAYYYRSEWPLLILTPSSMHYSWVEEIEHWLPEIEPTQINLIRGVSHVDCLSTAAVTVVSYGLLSFGKQLFLQHLLNQKFQVVIADESHYIKGRTATRSKTAVKVITCAKRAILLSGTPAISRPAELYSQISALQPNLFGSWYKFANRYCEGHRNKFGYFECSGAANLEELNQLLTENVMIRRLKSEVMDQLPSKIRQKIPFDILETEMKELQKSFDRLKKVFGLLSGSDEPKTSEDRVTRADANILLTEMFVKTGEAKISGILTYLIDVLEIAKRDTKFLVFAHHLVVQRAIAEVFIKKKIGFVHIYGEVPTEKRQEFVKRFQEDSETRVALLSLKAANTGITLTAATHVVFAELYWNPGELLQAEDRCHRIGQHKSVHIHYLIGKGSLDEMLWLMLCRKVAVTSTTLNGKTDLLRAEVLDKNLQQFMSACATSLSNQTASRHDNSGDVTYRHAIEAGDSVQKRHGFADLLISSPECYYGHISESDDESRLLDMEVSPLRHRTKPIRKMKRAIKRKDGSTDCKCIQEDQWHDSREFCKETRKFRNCEQFGKQSECIDVNDSDSYIHESAAHCVDCDGAEEESDKNECEILDKSEWSCPKCTYLNHADCHSCEMCHTAKVYRKSKERIITVKMSEMENECDYEAQRADVCSMKKSCQECEASENEQQQQQQTKLMDSDLLSEYVSVKSGPTQCESGQMTSHSDTDSNNKLEAYQYSNAVEIEVDSANCDESNNARQRDSEQLDSNSMAGKSLNNEIAGCMPATSTAPNNDATEITVIPETPPRRQQSEADDSENSDCCNDINEFLFGSSTKEAVNNVDEMNISSCTDVSIPSETGWDGNLLESVIGSEPDEWETETIATIFPASELETIGKHQHSTPSKRRKSSVSTSRNSARVSALIRHPDPPQYVPPTAPYPPKDGQFMFYVCHNTERIALYTNDQLYLQCTVSVGDVLYPVDGSLPIVLQSEINLQFVQKFVRDYVGLSVRDRALVRNYRRVISDVSSALSQIKKNTREKKVYSRCASKEKFNETAIIAATEAAAGELQIVEQQPCQKNKKRKGTRQSRWLIEDKESTKGNKRKKDQTQQLPQNDEDVKQAEQKTQQYVQGILADGQRICASCTKPFQPLVIPNSTEIPYGGRFCCRDCYMFYLVKTNRQAGRAVVAEQERGVCALCNVDTGELLCKLKVLTNMDDRMKLLKGTGNFCKLSEKVLSDIVQNPKAGKLWHADHICPVSCGGGACTRENLRALCVPCHRNETQNVKIQARGRGCKDIRKFLNKHN